MKKRKVNFWQMLLLFSVQLIFCQQLSAQIKGKVTDSSGSGVPGASIREKESKNVTITDNDGNYQIKTDNPKAVLVFSFIGLETQEVAVNGRKTINVTLADNSEMLNDVVVVAYGTQKKVSVTGAVASVSTKQLKESPTSNFVGSLTGKLPGLTTVQTSGQPGAENYNIYLRGAGTTNGQNPLILIDGVPRDNITSLDPNEIESLSVLKDASATAVFGVRGANGVILVTTKRGENETPQLNVTAEYGLQDYPTVAQPVNSYEFATLRNMALMNDGLNPFFTPYQIQKYKDGTSPYLYPNHNWAREMIKTNAPMTRYNLNVTGGNDRVKYFLNGSFTNQGGMYNIESPSVLGYNPQFNLNRYNFRANIDVKMNSWIKSSLNLSGYIDNVNEPGSLPADPGNVLYIVIGAYQQMPNMIGPTIQPGYSGGPVGEVSTGQNVNPAWGLLNRTGYVNMDRANLYSSLAFDFDLTKITKGLTSKVMVSFDSKSTAQINAIRNYNPYQYNLTQTTDPTTGAITDNLVFRPINTPQFYPLAVTKTTSFQYSINMQWVINYARSFGKNQVSAMLLAQRDNSEAVSGTSDNLLPYNVLGTAGRLTYNYDNRYLAEANMGYNGSEQFAPTNRFGFFPAGSVGWVVSNEKFMENQKIVNNLKLRASYGKVGNDKLGSTRFLYLDNVNLATTGSFNPALASNQYVNEALIGNPLITWETAYKQNYGIDLTLFKDLTFNGDYYIEHRDNILISQGITPALQGIPVASLSKVNAGVVDNSGYELVLTYNKKINKDLSFTISGNYNYNKSTVINLNEAPNDPSYAYQYQQTGQSLSQSWGYAIDWNSPGHGYWTSQDEITNSGLKFDGIQPKAGDFVYKDANHDGVINSKDYVPIKYGNLPRISYGLTLSGSYKGFEFTAMLQGNAQVSQYYSAWAVWENQVDGTFFKYMKNAWTPDLYNAGAQITYPRLTSLGSSSQAPNDFFIEDKSYIRLKNIQVAYTIPAKFTKKIGMQTVKIYANGQNLFLWDNLVTPNFDPESANQLLSVPIPRTFNFGVNIIF